MHPHHRVYIYPKAIKKLKNFYPSLYSDDLSSVEGNPQSGELVEVVTPEGEILGVGFYHPTAHIRVRLVSLEVPLKLDDDFIKNRLKGALALRHSLLSAKRKAIRWVHAEADSLPGLVVDQYNQYLVIQIRNAGMESIRGLVVQQLRSLLKPKGILERSDMEQRSEEGLPIRTELLWGEVPEKIQIEEHGFPFWVDPYHGQKTGYYLDQYDTRGKFFHSIKPKERVLDLFQYTASFGIGAARLGAQVIGMDLNKSAFALAKENAKLNGLKTEIEFIEGDAFYLLQVKADQKEKFDWLILDPPSLAKRRDEIPQARYKLQKLIYNGLCCLNPGGKLLVSICTYHLHSIFEELVRIAAGDLRKKIWIFDQSQQSPDHPHILQIPESYYLRSLFCQVL